MSGITDISLLFVLPEYRYARCDVVGNSALSFRERQDIEGPIFLRQMVGSDSYSFNPHALCFDLLAPKKS